MNEIWNKTFLDNLKDKQESEDKEDYYLTCQEDELKKISEAEALSRQCVIKMLFLLKILER